MATFRYRTPDEKSGSNKLYGSVTATSVA
jgi:hypothetical protein